MKRSDHEVCIYFRDFVNWFKMKNQAAEAGLKLSSGTYFMFVPILKIESGFIFLSISKRED